jgi:hypothetical protein
MICASHQIPKGCKTAIQCGMGHHDRGSGGAGSKSAVLEAYLAQALSLGPRRTLAKEYSQYVPPFLMLHNVLFRKG